MNLFRTFVTRRILSLLLLMLGCWLFSSYLLSSYVVKRRFDDDVQGTSRDVEASALAVSYHLDRSLSYLFGVPAIVAENQEVRRALTVDAAVPAPEVSSAEARREELLRRPGADSLNRHLSVVATELGVDMVWVVNPAGYCIASSNYQTRQSFIGINYSDRTYIQTALAGERARQYAVGRATNVPGFLLSAPVKEGKRVVGVAVVKIEVAKLSHWFKRFNCFVTNEAGVIILASDSSLELHALPGAQVLHMPPAERQQLYKRTKFPLLHIVPFRAGGRSYMSATFPSHRTPVLMAQRHRTSDGYTVFSYADIAGLNELSTTILQVATLIFVSGAALLLLGTAMHCYVQDMRVARTAAEEANRCKSEFLATMSHEIRTPMNGIIGLARVMLDTPLSQEQKLYMESLKSSADALLTIINDILDFSKIEAGKIEMESISFSLQRCLESTLHPFKVRAQEKKIGFSMRIEEGIPERLVGDPVRLCQVLNNLLSNAIKFTSKGGVTLSCILKEREEEQVVLEFSVADTGIGIPQEMLESIFEKFTQADASTTRIYGGTGLGLAITQRLTELMGGTIRVESLEGKGSTFTFTVPLTLPGALEEERRLLPVNRAMPRCRPLHILVVDDVPVNQLVSEKTIAKTGDHTVVRAGNGKEALERWESGEFDLIFMDVQMPVMDGLEATRSIRRREGGRQRVHICAMTANALKEDVQICRNAGMDSYIAKPVQLEEVYRVVSLVAGPAATEGTEVVREKDAPAPTAVGARPEAAGARPEETEAVQPIAAEAVQPEAVQAAQPEAVQAAQPEAAATQPEVATLAPEAMHIPTPPVPEAKALDGADPAPLPFIPTLPPVPATATVNAVPPFDRKDFLNRCGVDDDFLQRALPVFIDNVNMRICEVESAIVHNDLDEVRLQAHALKGVAANMSAPSLTAIARLIEGAAKTGDVEEIRRLQPELRRAAAAFKSAVSREVTAT